MCYLICGTVPIDWICRTPMWVRIRRSGAKRFDRRNPSVTNERTRSRSTLEYAMPTPYDHTWRAVRVQILERDNHTCQVRGPKCGGKATQVDHIIPLAEGGARLDHDNLRASCSQCNAARGNTRSAELAKALERPAQHGQPSRKW